MEPQLFDIKLQVLVSHDFYLLYMYVHIKVTMKICSHHPILKKRYERVIKIKFCVQCMCNTKQCQTCSLQSWCGSVHLGMKIQKRGARVVILLLIYKGLNCSEVLEIWKFLCCKSFVKKIVSCSIIFIGSNHLQ